MSKKATAKDDKNKVKQTAVPQSSEGIKKPKATKKTKEPLKIPGGEKVLNAKQVRLFATLLGVKTVDELIANLNEVKAENVASEEKKKAKTAAAAETGA